MNMFREKHSKPVEVENLLPFPPKPRYLSVEESEEMLNRFFDAYVQRTEVGNGH